MLNIMFLNKLIEMNSFIIFIIFLSNLESFYCPGDEKKPVPPSEPHFIFSLNDANYFNNIIMFDNNKYYSSNCAINENGDIILELFGESKSSSSRLFYGLTNDGRYFFSNQSSYTQEINVNLNEGVYEFGYYNPNSLNLFVSIENDPNSNNQYLFSINSYYSVVELLKLNDDYITHYYWNFKDFFRLNENSKFQYDYSLFEVKNEATYFIAFVPKEIVNQNILNEKFIIQFKFNSFNKGAYEEIKNIVFNEYNEKRIINVFYMDDRNNLVVFYEQFESGDETNERQGGFGRRLNSLGYFYKLYDNNLNEITTTSGEYISSIVTKGEIIPYFKSLYLGNQIVIFASIFDTYSILFETYNIGESIAPDQNSKVYMDNFYFAIDESLSDLVKIDDRRFAFIYTGIYNIVKDADRLRNLQDDNKNSLFIILFDIYDYDFELNKKIFVIFLENIIPKIQLSANIYNGYLLIATTAIKKEEYSNNEDSQDYLSLFMIFGYANGTDNTADISYFLSDHENYGQLNYTFFDLLFNNLIIENNIFNYTSDGRIKLISIPEEILIFKDSEELLSSENDIYFYLDNNYTLK